jgi:antiviral helicase SKI2
MVDYLQKNTLCPAVIFVFSIKKITEYTRMLSNKNFLNEQEKNKIIKFFNEAISSEISKEDQNIPQISETLEILKSGIGLHHAGLLPILKEIIEVLYSQGLIKVLFATTSFSIGLNMPTRTVVFTDVYKYNDGKKEILTLIILAPFMGCFIVRNWDW